MCSDVQYVSIIVKRVIFPQIPPKVEYSITKYGRSLEPIMKAMHIWGDAHVEHMRVKNAKKEQEILS
jgi:DNA-binding HxlR family transcriptional regulator